MGTVTAISVVIAEQSKAFRASYTKRLRPEAGIEVVAEAASGYEVVRALKLRPQVLLLDSNISAVYGLSLLPLVRHQSPSTRIILMTERASRTRMIDALSLGARGYLKKALAPDVLAKAVRVVDRGEVWVPRGVVGPILQEVGRLSEHEAP
jgi:DNA-binding NarL/FixJ family response regulator